jgi:hypothetical protein
LYLAGSEEVVFAELGSPSEGIQIARVQLKTSGKVLNLGSEDLASDVLKAVALSSLVSAPANGMGWDKPEYTFSRFVADCAVKAGFRAIRYPSVARPTEFNLVVLSSDQQWSALVHIGSIAEFHLRKAKGQPDG